MQQKIDAVAWYSVELELDPTYFIICVYSNTNTSFPSKKCNTTFFLLFQPTSDLGLFTGMSVSNVSTVQSHRTAAQAPLSRGIDILKPVHLLVPLTSLIYQKDPT